MFHIKTTQAAKGKWRGVLMSLGMPDTFLRDKHGPCPLCGGTDRFRWDNKEGSGSYICNNCGAGDGMKLATEYFGKPFHEMAAQIDGILGNVKPDAPGKPAMSDDDIRRAIVGVWKASKPVQPGDLVHAYLASRHLDELIYPPALRFAEQLRDGEGGIRPCMVAMVGRYGEPKFDTMHRTFLRPDGKAKAEMQSPRKVMPGSLPDGACVMLSDWTESGPLGVAEGIETAMAASAMFDIPVWAALNSGQLAKWLPPVGCEEVVIFGDNDAKYGGHAAAYALAHRVAVKGLPVSVQIPPTQGDDWADVWARKHESKQEQEQAA
jgi:putative DNA primase/helicase